MMLSLQQITISSTQLTIIIINPTITTATHHIKYQNSTIQNERRTTPLPRLLLQSLQMRHHWTQHFSQTTSGPALRQLRLLALHMSQN
jgi:hypothetical protein